MAGATHLKKRFLGLGPREETQRYDKNRGKANERKRKFVISRIGLGL